MGKYYAVKVGKKPGIYYSWDICKKNVTGYKGAIYKSFKTLSEAKDFMGIDFSDTDETKDKKIEAKEISLEEIPEKTCIAYVDGSFNIANSKYGSGIILIDSNHNEYSFMESGEDKDLASMRNVAGEIYASIRAVKEAINLGFEKIIIHYDYKGIECWAKGLWKANKEGTKAYKNYMKEKSKEIEIDFVKVKAHSGVLYNEKVDVLAKKAAGVL